jgi:preprotein translocase subunit SecB
VVSDLITRGSFPQFTLQPVNFEQMYAQQMASKKESAEKTH